MKTAGIVAALVTSLLLSGSAWAADPPKTDAPKADVKKADVKKVDAPKVEVKKAEVKKADAPRADVKPAVAPKIEVKKAEAKKADVVKKAEAPKVDAKKCDVNAPAKMERPCPFAGHFLAKLNLTAEQKTKLEQLHAQYRPTFEAARKAFLDVLTVEQKQTLKETVMGLIGRAFGPGPAGPHRFGPPGQPGFQARAWQGGPPGPMFGAPGRSSVPQALTPGKASTPDSVALTASLLSVMDITVTKASVASITEIAAVMANLASTTAITDIRAIGASTTATTASSASTTATTANLASTTAVTANLASTTARAAVSQRVVVDPALGRSFSARGPRPGPATGPRLGDLPVTYQILMLVNQNPEQKAKADAIRKDIGPKMVEALKKVESLKQELQSKLEGVLTVEQKAKLKLVSEHKGPAADGNKPAETKPAPGAPRQHHHGEHGDRGTWPHGDHGPRPQAD